MLLLTLIHCTKDKAQVSENSRILDISQNLNFLEKTSLPELLTHLPGLTEPICEGIQ